MSKSIFYVNGDFVAQSHASLSVLDLGLLRSYGVFDFTVTYNRRPFRLNDHLERLRNSARLIDLYFPWSNDELAELIYQTLDRNPEGEKGIRIVVTGGEGPDAFTPAEKPSLIILVKPFPIFPKEFFTKGVKVITFQGKRQMPEAKTLNYVNAMKALQQARVQGAEEALYVDEGNIYECMVCSFFAVKEGKIITANEGVLDGITRKTVLELVKDKIPVDYRCVKVSELLALDEAFLTSSGHQVMPITTVDQTSIGNGKPGPITQNVMTLFGEYTGMKLI